MNKTKVLEELEVLGFDIEEVPDFGYVFKYEGLVFIYMPDDDENFLRFAAPNFFDVTKDNRAFVLEVVNDTNLTIKYCKACVFGDQVWAFYEYRLFGDNELEEIIEHCLHLLYATVGLFCRKVDGEDEEDDDNDNEEEGSV